MIQPLEPVNSLHLKAAEGWLEFGKHAEANADLEKIAPNYNDHPDVLHARWVLCAAPRMADSSAWL